MAPVLVADIESLASPRWTGPVGGDPGLYLCCQEATPALSSDPGLAVGSAGPLSQEPCSCFFP